MGGRLGTVAVILVRIGGVVVVLCLGAFSAPRFLLLLTALFRVVSRVYGRAYCWDTRGIVFGL